MKIAEVPVANAKVGDEYVHIGERGKKTVGVIRDIRWAGRYDRTQVIVSVKFPGAKKDHEYRHELLGTMTVPGVATPESDAAENMAIIHAAAVARVVKRFKLEDAA